MELINAPWMWLIIGAALMLAETLSLDFVLFFFGLSAVTIGVADYAFHMPLTIKVGLFAVLSIVYIVALRRYLKTVFRGDKSVADGNIENDYVGRLGKVVELIRPEVPGRIVVGDSEWTATAKERLEPGAEIKVVAQKNLTFEVEPIK